MSLKIDLIIKKVNQQGLTYSPKEQYQFISLAGRSSRKSGGMLLVKIKNLLTKEIKICRYHSLISGSNPFNQSHDRHEEKIVHPKIRSFLIKLGLNVEQEFFISKRSRVDFLCTSKNNKKIIIEVKSDKKSHSSNSITEQIHRYSIDGRKRFGKLFFKTYLVSPNGTYGYSIKELNLALKQDNLL